MPWGRAQQQILERADAAPRRATGRPSAALSIRMAPKHSSRVKTEHRVTEDQVAGLGVGVHSVLGLTHLPNFRFGWRQSVHLGKNIHNNG